jgi:hypothetical protein
MEKIAAQQRFLRLRIFVFPTVDGHLDSYLLLNKTLCLHRGINLNRETHLEILQRLKRPFVTANLSRECKKLSTITIAFPWTSALVSN